MKCEYAGCDNSARYIDEIGALCCAICPLKYKLRSVRLIDLPAMLWPDGRAVDPQRPAGAPCTRRGCGWFGKPHSGVCC